MEPSPSKTFIELEGKLIAQLNEYNEEKGFIDFLTVSGNRVILPLSDLKGSSLQFLNELEYEVSSLVNRKKLYLTAETNIHEYVGIFEQEDGFYVGTGDLRELKLNDYDFEGLVPTKVLDKQYVAPNFAYEDFLTFL